jgi:hypothetical protein
MNEVAMRVYSVLAGCRREDRWCQWTSGGIVKVARSALQLCAILVGRQVRIAELVYVTANGDAHTICKDRLRCFRVFVWFS